VNAGIISICGTITFAVQYMKKIRILISDDHEVVRKGLALVLRQEPDFEIVGEAQDGAETLLKACQLKPDLVLLDWKMPRMDGVTAARNIRRKLPAVRILMLSGAPIERDVINGLNAGVDGFVHKDISPDNLTVAIRLVASGQPYLGSEVTQALIRQAQWNGPQPVSLSPREMDVLRLLITPATYRQIGVQLSISEETVRSHVKSILMKLNQPNRTQAVIAALRAELISFD